ncbi:MAG: alpha/beta hydrolase, partial [Myxococcales bacterium]|nr:alpha/beta hydrolase [Myxococcales bacterium]
MSSSLWRTSRLSSRRDRRPRSPRPSAAGPSPQAARRSARLLAVGGALTSVLACAPKQEPETRPPERRAKPAPATAPKPVAASPVDWGGDVETPGSPLRMIVHLEPSDAEGDDGWRGKVDLPQSGVKELLVRDLEVTDEGFDFVLAPPGAPESRWVFVAVEHDRGADEAVGTFEQAGQSFPLRLRRLAPGEEFKPPRPQTPQAPFPYASRDIEVVRGDLKLACSMVVPAGEGPFPAAALLSGSGAQDRDETIFDHKPFLVLADRLARDGVASLRCDDRGVGGSTGELMTTTQDELTDDALAMIDALAGDLRVDPKAIGMIGHSEGAMLAPQAAVTAPDKVAFVVLLAGPGVPGREILTQQSSDLSAAMGKTPEAVEAEAEAHRAMVDAVVKGADRDALAAKIEALVDLQIAGKGLDDATKRALVNQAVDQMTSPWFVSFLKSDPQQWLRKLKRPPVLAIGGDLDLQVRAQENLEAIAKGLKRARNKDVTTKELAGLNHFNDTATTETVAEYAHDLSKETSCPGDPIVGSEAPRRR